MTAPDSLDRLVRDYLDAVARAIADLPADRRADLLDDLSRHIAAERAELDEVTEADVRAIIERLGDPGAIAAEARVQEDPRVAPRMSRAAPYGVIGPDAGRPVHPGVPTVPPAVPLAWRGLGPAALIALAVGVVLVSCLVIALLGVAYRVDGGDSPAPGAPRSPRPSTTTGR